MTLVIFSIIINFILIKYNKNIAYIFNIYDKPDANRKLHKKIVPVTGGIIIFLNIFFLSFFLLFYPNFFMELNIFKNPQDFYLFLFGLVIFFFIGFYDDKYDISANLKFILMLFVLIPIVFLSENLLINAIQISFLKTQYSLSIIPSVIWTVLCFLLFINALNMFDGINFQVGAFSIYLCIFFIINNYFSIFFIIILISLSFFLYLNKNNRSFLGDSGSYLLAFIFSYFFIKLYNQENIIYSDHVVLFMIIPGLDLMRLFIIRIYNGKNPFTPDRKHLHHILLSKHSILITNLITQLIIILPSMLGYIYNNTSIFLIIQLTAYFYFIIFYKLKH